MCQIGSIYLIHFLVTLKLTRAISQDSILGRVIYFSMIHQTSTNDLLSYEDYSCLIFPKCIEIENKFN